MRPLTIRVLQRLRTLNHWMVAQFARLGLGILRRLPPDKALNFADRFARKVGPWFGRHRVALGLSLALGQGGGIRLGST